MSDLANSCEYLTSEKLCLAVSESEKAKANRQVRCKNDEKTACCYLCMFVLDCATHCQFLGNAENEPISIEVQKIGTENIFINHIQIKENTTENGLIPCCSLCNVEMSQARTKLSIYERDEPNQKLADDGLEKLAEEVLPIIIYICPKCGKIDLKADKKLNKK